MAVYQVSKKFVEGLSEKVAVKSINRILESILDHDDYVLIGIGYVLMTPFHYFIVLKHVKLEFLAEMTMPCTALKINLPSAINDFGSEFMEYVTKNCLIEWMFVENGEKTNIFTNYGAHIGAYGKNTDDDTDSSIWMVCYPFISDWANCYIEKVKQKQLNDEQAQCRVKVEEARKKNMEIIAQQKEYENERLYLRSNLAYLTINIVKILNCTIAETISQNKTGTE